MTFQPGANLYPVAFGTRPENVEVPHIENRAPVGTDTQNGTFPIGKRWIDTIAGNEYSLTSYSVSQGVTTANWAFLGSSSGDLNTLSGDTGTATPSSSNIKIAGTANQIVTSASGSTVTLALTGPYTPATYTAHGVLLGEGTSSIVATAAGATGSVLAGNTGADPSFQALTGLAVTSITGTANQITASAATGAVTLSTPVGFVAPGSVTSTTTLTATLGDVTATNGNFVGTAAGKGLLLNSPAASGVASGPVVVNGRSGQATFTTVSIAAAADLTLTITNSAITGSTTQVIYSMSGATTGAALSIKSVTNTAGSSAIVVTNGTGATTTTADIVLNFIVIN